MLTGFENWSEIYETQKRNLPVLPDVDEAVAWTNNLIAKIDAAGASSYVAAQT